MLTAEQINSIHRLHWAEHWSVRKIARHLHLARRTISQYLVTPARSAARRQRASKLDPFKATIAELLGAKCQGECHGDRATTSSARLHRWSEYPERLLTRGSN
jgi:transposase